jgi:SPW repeat
MATPLARRPEPGDGSPQAAVTISAVTEYLLPATKRGIAAQAVAALGVLTGLWIALSPSFITLQHGGGNAAAADLIAGLAVAAVGAAALAGPRGFAGLQFATALLGAWVVISPFILAAKFSIAAPMYWSNTFSGGYLVVLALAGLATVRRAAR